eukprot:3408697-Rhodomonas_salina.1
MLAVQVVGAPARDWTVQSVSYALCRREPTISAPYHNWKLQEPPALQLQGEQYGLSIETVGDATRNSETAGTTWANQRPERHCLRGKPAG